MGYSESGKETVDDHLHRCAVNRKFAFQYLSEVLAKRSQIRLLERRIPVSEEDTQRDVKIHYR